ncbi:hypothetical protein THAOC_20239 [Thalassiosira oceanica]|uniref:Uncharacterized protein n=1 Tax=Thalassiosira oceanica TaxID=159749 RepID=K0S3U4_THAOC|nr:hypothetical protein THAOC_20239 [Thalassiosira oceanica]|eukprot:EJK59529.1 hypothetical protein THAOC_20239 [Thalassiosira oceanica]
MRVQSQVIFKSPEFQLQPTRMDPRPPLSKSLPRVQCFLCYVMLCYCALALHPHPPLGVAIACRPSRKETHTTLKGWPLDQAAEADVLPPRSASPRVVATVAVPSDIGVTIIAMTDYNGLHLQVVVRRGRVRQPRQREQQRPIRDQIERKEDGFAKLVESESDVESVGARSAVRQAGGGEPPERAPPASERGTKPTIFLNGFLAIPIPGGYV